MGRKKRHTSRTGDGGAELRLQKQRAAAAEREQKEAELAFYDDPSEGENASEDVDSDGSEFGNDGGLELGADNSDDGDSDSDSDADDDANADGAMDDDDDDNTEDFAGQKKKILQMDGQWGKAKKNFYSADTAEFELDSDDEAAKDEEDAALELQRKQNDMMDDEDFGFDAAAASASDLEAEEDDDHAPVDDEDLANAQLAAIDMLIDDDDAITTERVPKDFSQLTKNDKLQLVNQSAPELLGLMSELESTIVELRTVVTPAIHKLKTTRSFTNDFAVGLQFLITKQNLLLNYIQNISFYLLLKAENKRVVDHPVLTHLLLVKNQLERLAPLEAATATQLDQLLTNGIPLPKDDGLDQFFSRSAAAKRRAKKQAKATAATATATATTVANAAPSKHKTTTTTTKSDTNASEAADAAAFYEQALAQKRAAAATKKALYAHETPAALASSDSEDDDSDAGATKRGATYEIIKNKGLKAHKSKLNRNPRVKKRMQFRKAVIRRKGQVRDVRVGESGKYGGETTGIKANLTRSRKIRN